MCFLYPPGDQLGQTIHIKPGKIFFIFGASCLSITTPHALYIGKYMDVNSVLTHKSLGLHAHREAGRENVVLKAGGLTRASQVLDTINSCLDNIPRGPRFELDSIYFGFRVVMGCCLSLSV